MHCLITVTAKSDSRSAQVAQHYDPIRSDPKTAQHYDGCNSCLGPSISEKLWEARSRLHRRRFLQVNRLNTQLEEFFKIYKISAFPHLQ